MQGTTSLVFDPPVIAHRGASAYAPENTLAAFTQAALLNIHWVEFDVMQAACGELIVMHDDDLNRTSNGKGQVVDYPYRYLQTLDAGTWFHPQFADERIPTFAQVLKFLHDSKMNANIEIKALPQYEKQQVRRMVDEIKPYLQTQTFKILFSSFSFKALYLLRDLLPEADIGLLLHAWEPNWENITQELNCVSIHIYQRILTKRAVQQIKSMGKIVLSYTVNKPDTAKRLFSWGVDAVFSDVPDVIAKLEGRL